MIKEPKLKSNLSFKFEFNDRNSSFFKFKKAYLQLSINLIAYN